MAKCGLKRGDFLWYFRKCLWGIYKTFVKAHYSKNWCSRKMGSFDSGGDPRYVQECSLVVWTGSVIFFKNEDSRSNRSTKQELSGSDHGIEPSKKKSFEMLLSSTAPVPMVVRTEEGGIVEEMAGGGVELSFAQKRPYVCVERGYNTCLCGPQRSISRPVRASKEICGK